MVNLIVHNTLRLAKIFEVFCFGSRGKKCLNLRLFYPFSLSRGIIDTIATIVRRRGSKARNRARVASIWKKYQSRFWGEWECWG